MMNDQNKATGGVRERVNDTGTPMTEKPRPGLSLSKKWTLLLPMVLTMTLMTVSSITAADKPQLLVISDVHATQLTAYGRFLAREIITAFANKNINVINPSQLQRIHDEFHKLKSSMSTPDAAINTGKLFNASLALAFEYSAESRTEDPNTQKLAAHCQLNATIYECASGKILFTKQLSRDHHTGPTEHNAIHASLANLAQSFVAEAHPVIEAWWKTRL